MALCGNSTSNKQALVQVVQRCIDQNNNGFIERQQFISFCGDLSVSADELENVFDALDGDSDGRINVTDFTTSFDQISELMFAKQSDSLAVNGSADKSIFECQVNGLESPMQVMAGQQYISELYYNLNNSNQPDLVDLFEKHLASVVKDIKARASENQRLEEALKRATKQHARQVNNLDREMESQMEKLEAKVREEEKLLFDKKLSDLQWQLDNKDNEISTMSKALDTLHGKLSKETSKPSRRHEIDSICQENRLLKSQVTDSQTALALLRSELAELRSEFVEQSELLQKEQRTSQDSLAEQENLTRQLQLLHEANQRLHDINDELRGALEAKKASSPVRSSVEVMKLSGVFSDPGRDLSSSFRSNKSYGRRSTTPISPRAPPAHENDGGENSFNVNEDSLFSEIHRASTPYKSDVDEDEAYGTMANENNNVHKQIRILEDTNKRLSSSNDELRVALKLIARSGSFRKPRKASPCPRRSKSFTGSDYGSLSSRSSRSQSMKQKRSSHEVGEATDESTTYDAEDDEVVGTTSDSATMNSETIADVEGQFSKVKNETSKEEEGKTIDDEDDDDDLNSEDLAKLVAFASDMTDNSATESDSEHDIKDNTRRDSQASGDHEDTSTMTTDSMSQYGAPERMYKLVLAGDAAVGKSSFILRLCRNKFHSNLNATLGVDFQVKNIRVDSKTVALQLWDTAGQERFRSIAKSYFRKVDGVLLLYDVTNEASFVNIRDWMRTIEESSHRKAPIMLCANKCDLREEYRQDDRTVVSKESGERLAESYGAMFIETSAKDGKHIEDACKELARVLTSLENEEIQQHGMKLDKGEREKKRKCCSS